MRRKIPLTSLFFKRRGISFSHPPPSQREGGGKRRGMGNKTSPTLILPLQRRGRIKRESLPEEREEIEREEREEKEKVSRRKK